MTLKLRILRSLTRLFIILVSLTRSLSSEKMLNSNRCISGLMPNLIKKSWTATIVSVYLFLVKFLFELYKVSLACMMIFNEFFRTRYKNEQILFFCFFQSSFFFSTSFGGRPKTKKAEYSKKAKATDITENMIQSNLQRLRFNQSNIESSSNKSSEKTQDKTQLVEFLS